MPGVLVMRVSFFPFLRENASIQWKIPASLFSSQSCLCSSCPLRCGLLFTFSCGESTLPVPDCFLCNLHWCGNYLVASVGGREFRVFYSAIFARGSWSSPPHPTLPFLFKYLMLGRPTPGLSSLGKEEQMEENCGGWEGLCGKSGLQWLLLEGSKRITNSTAVIRSRKVNKACALRCTLKKPLE